MAVPPMIGTPGGVRALQRIARTFDAHRAALDVLGGSRFVGDDPGLAALHDLALLSGMYGMFAGVSARLRAGPLGGRLGEGVRTHAPRVAGQPWASS